MASSGFKVFIVGLAIIQWIIAFVFLVAGIYVFATFGNIKEFAEAMHTLVPASILIAAAVILILLGVAGMYGAIKEHKCALSLFFILSGALFVVEFVGAVMALAMQPQFEQTLDKAFGQFMGSYNTSVSIHDEVDWMQRTLHCCGQSNYTDWYSHGYSADYLPVSCCQLQNMLESCNSTTIQVKKIPGCVTKLHDAFFNNLGIIGGVGLAFAFIQLIALIGVLYLVCKRSRNYNELF